ncbi:hypothetical protein ES288_A04G023000v1 [Gossypium darwinii]|uniref:Reverse transcriptase zinc-binding domain-containing protein n=1 Tax=Gossypium darwinii TaxID=34276 RepID=A0A5D2GV16_GOSDA|nr:hypothetical protein ES288_A04G023000v1 [Gossypium darwinii]
MLDDGENNIFDCGKLWKIKVPPRVRCFLWMLAIDRLSTKEFLVKRGVSFQNLTINCSWCDGVPECASHLFFKCKFIEGFWGRIFKWWEVAWKQVEGFLDFFVLCNNVRLAEIWKQLSLIAIEAACWTVWLARNELIFDKKRVYMENLVYQSKMRALLWIRSIHEEIFLKENLWWISPLRCQVDSIKSKPAVFCWRPLPVGWLKFNVCGIELEDKAGCGGVLRDMEGVARVIFSGAVNVNNAEEAEIGAVKIALEVFLAMNWKPKESLFIKIGSLVALSWCVNKVLRPWSLQSAFAEIEIAMLKVGNVVFSLAGRKGIGIVFSLAMVGVNRTQIFKAWW